MNFLVASDTSVRVNAFICLIVTAWALTQNFPLSYWMIALAMYFIYGCFGVVVLYHRFLSHHSFKLSRWKEIVLSLIAACAGTGSAIGWVSLHTTHHMYSDTKDDPNSPKSHFLLFYNLQKVSPRRVMFLVRDKFHSNIHRFYTLIILGWMLSLYLLGGLPALLFVYMIPSFLIGFASIATNYSTHHLSFGYKNFETKDRAVNNWLIALLVFGEGWHNNHHAFPRKASTKHHWWEFDISNVVIELIKTR